MLPVSCPGCGKRLKVKDDLAGKKVRCTQCGQPVSVPAAPGVAAAGKASGSREARSAACEEESPPSLPEVEFSSETDTLPPAGESEASYDSLLDSKPLERAWARRQDSSVDERARRDFEASWRSGRPQPIERFLPLPSDAAYVPTLLELAMIELELAWKASSETATLRDDQAVDPPRRRLFAPLSGLEQAGSHQRVGGPGVSRSPPVRRPAGARGVRAPLSRPAARERRSVPCPWLAAGDL